MHQPRPYGLHVVGLPLTENDDAFIIATTQRITNLREVSGVENIRMVYDLPDGGYVIVQDMGGNFRVIAHKPIPKPERITDGLAKNFVPMLYSGMVMKSVVFPREGVQLKITEETRHRLRGYDASNNLPAKVLELQRFRIDYDNRFGEFKPKLESEILQTQYTQLRPTWYSGAMAEVMQIVGGYGRQDAANLPNLPIERDNLYLPQDVMDAIGLEVGGLRLPASTGLPPTSGAMQYDYKFNNTNAIGFDPSGKPWLLEISQRGVWAMPLPIVPATATKAFRRYMEDMGDTEIIAILNKFGAMPSGETFPSYSKDFEAWRRAGVIIKVCDTSDFYSHIAYSSTIGWSLNAKGTEGYNTCYNYYDDEGLGYGLTYKLRLDLAASSEYGGKSTVDLDLTDSRMIVVRDYIAQLLPTISGNSAESLAILYKLRRVSTDDIYDRALNNNGYDDKDYWNNLELEPIANHQGKVSEVNRGYLYHPSKAEFQPQIKFPEPLAGGCVSHNFLPLANGRYKDKYPNSDTIMLAYYIENTLNVVKYFVDWNRFKRSTTSNFEKYMRAGSWSQTETTGESSIHGYFYSTSIDEREVVDSSVTYTSIEGVDKGYGSKPKFAFDGLGFMCGDLYRDRYYTHKTSTEQIDGRQLDLAICVPYFCRNAIIYAKKDTTEARTLRESLFLHSVRDPTYYRFYTYHPIFAYQYMTINNPKGEPKPSNGSPVWVEEEYYKPYSGCDFADGGSWLPSLPYDYTDLIHPDSNVWNVSFGGVNPKVEEYNNTTKPVTTTTGSLQISLMDYPVLINKEVPSILYYIASPSEIGNIFYRDACAIVFGEATYKNVSEPSKNSYRAYWGGSKIPDHKSAHHFIGVINE